MWNKVHEISPGILSPIAFLGPSRVATKDWGKCSCGSDPSL